MSKLLTPQEMDEMIIVGQGIIPAQEARKISTSFNKVNSVAYHLQRVNHKIKARAEKYYTSATIHHCEGLPQEIYTELERNGYTWELSGHDLIIRWEE